MMIYCDVVFYMNDFSRYTWVDFIIEKSNTLKNEKDHNIGNIINDQGKKFKKANFAKFHHIHGITHE